MLIFADEDELQVRFKSWKALIKYPCFMHIDHKDYGREGMHCWCRCDKKLGGVITSIRCTCNQCHMPTICIRRIRRDWDGTGDLSKIIQSYLGDVKWHKNVHVIKMLSQLIAVSEYVKLCICYKLHKVCKQPCLKASIAIAHWMSKGPYFTCKIHYHELYLLKHHHLPHYKEYAWHG